MRCWPVAVALLAALLAWAPGAGAAINYELIPDPTGVSVEQPPLARLTRSEVEQLAEREPVIADAIGLRPGAGMRVRFLPTERRWRVSIRDGRSVRLLASIEVDDTTRAIVERDTVPLGEFPSRHTEREAIDAAVADARVEDLASEWGGLSQLRARGELEFGVWEVDFFDPDRRDGNPERPVIRALVADATLKVDGAWTGHAIYWQLARGSRESFGGIASRPQIWLAFMVLFAAAMIDWRRLRSLATVDVLAVLVLGISHEAFQRGAIEWSVPLAVPPLLWIAGRMWWLFRHGVPHPRPAADIPHWARRLRVRPAATMLLVVLCVCLAGLRTGMAWYGGNVIDVGYASVAGARAELAGEAPWGNLPNDVTHGDTYGPVTYLAYVPATALDDDPSVDSAAWGVPAGAAMAIAMDLACALLLAWLGVRWLSRRAGALLALGWLACPWTMWAVGAGTNDGLVAFLVLVAFAAIRVDWLRGALLGVATMTKFAPAILLAPLLHVGSRRRLHQSAATAVAFAVSIVASLAWVAWRMDGSAIDDLRRFWDLTLGFQSDRGSPFSIWGLYGWDVAQRVAQGVVALVAIIAFFRPRERDAWQVAAGIAALLILAQLVVTHWTYLYVPWFMPFLLLVLVAQRERPAVSRDLMRDDTLSARSARLS